MHAFDGQFINEEFYAGSVKPADLDLLLADGWRHFGTHFFRYNFGMYEFDLRRVIPLRIRLADFSYSKSLRRILRRNSSLRTAVGPINVDTDVEQMFAEHALRFNYGRPDSVYDFLSHEPAAVPVPAFEVKVFEGDKLIAASFFDAGEHAVSGIYGMFDPAEERRSLGIFTMLKEIEFAMESGKDFYYQGYCYEGESFYDYKKRFRATECYDWRGNWTAFESAEQNAAVEARPHGSANP